MPHNILPVIRHPTEGNHGAMSGACLYVFVDDIAVRAPTRDALLETLDTLHEGAHMMGMCFNKDKTEGYHWAKK